jgi:hypothetical protein
MILNVNLERLKTFYVVAKCGGVRLAARVLKLAPSTISKQLTLSGDWQTLDWEGTRGK